MRAPAWAAGAQIGARVDPFAEPTCVRLAGAAASGQCDVADELGEETMTMERDELRALQEPLKQQYRDDPDAAMITLSAVGHLGEGVTCSVATGRAIANAGLHPATGGDGLSLCSGDMLLEALAACAGVTLGAVATSLDIPVRGGAVRVEGDLDFRGTLAVTKDAAVGFREIRVAFDLDTDATDEQLATLMRLTERYCVVMQTLTHSPTMTFGRSTAA